MKIYTLQEYAAEGVHAPINDGKNAVDGHATQRCLKTSTRSDTKRRKHLRFDACSINSKHAEHELAISHTLAAVER
jgi:hypothetical protein